MASIEKSPSEALLELFENVSGLTAEETSAETEKLDKEIRKQEGSLRQRVRDLKAELFYERFTKLVRRGVIRRLELEADPNGGCGDPGSRQHFLLRMRGWINIHQFDSKYLGSGNEKKLEVPEWLEQAMEKLRQAGWELEVRPHVFSEAGVGNTQVAYLCVHDPRLAAVSAKT